MATTSQRSPAPTGSGLGRTRKGPLGRLFGALWNRGATEATLLIAAAAVASGVVFGAGVARATSQTSDGQTWVSAGDGTIVQINPVTGQPVSRIATGVEGTVTVQQGSGVVLVNSPTSGQTVSIDVGQLVASAPRTDTTGKHKWLLRSGKAFVAGLQDGTVRAVDPISGVNVGETYVANGKLADAAIDAAGTIWVLDESGTVTALTYSTDAHRFIVDTTSTVDGAGPGSAMIPHARGVTVISAATKAVVQVGTGQDRAVQIPALDGAVQPADYSPRDLTAITVTDRGSVIILDGENVRVADMAAAGCDKPGKPAVFAGKIYIPCQGKGRTIVLDRTGQSAREDIVTGETDDPQITVDDDAVVVASSSADRAVSVDVEGKQHSTVLRDKKIPVRTPRKAAPPGPSSMPTPSTPVAPSSPEVPSNPEQSSEQQSSSSEQPSLPGDDEQPTSEPQEQSWPSVNTSTTPPSVPDVPMQDPSTSSTAKPSTSNQPNTSTATSTSNQPNTSSQTSTSVATGDIGPATGVTAELTSSGKVRVTWTAPASAPKSYLIRTVTGAASTEVGGSATSATVSAAGLSGTVQFVVVAKFSGNRRVVSAASNAVQLNGSEPTGASTTAQTSTAGSTSTGETSAVSSTASTSTKDQGTGVVGSSQAPDETTTASSTPTTVTPTSVTPTSVTPTTATPTSVTKVSSPVETPTPTSVMPTTAVETPTPSTVVQTPTPESPTPTPTPTPESPTPEPTTSTVAPQPPAPPANLAAQREQDANIVVATWSEEAGLTYDITYYRNGIEVANRANVRSGDSYPFGASNGTVKVTVVAVGPGGTSAPASAETQIYRQPIECLRDGGAFQGRPICPTTPVCGPDMTCQIPLRDGGAFQQREPEHLSPVQRYGSAAGLVALAGLVTLARRRMRARQGAHENSRSLAALGDGNQV